MHSLFEHFRHYIIIINRGQTNVQHLLCSRVIARRVVGYTVHAIWRVIEEHEESCNPILKKYKTHETEQEQ